MVSLGGTIKRITLSWLVISLRIDLYKYAYIVYEVKDAEDSLSLTMISRSRSVQIVSKNFKRFQKTCIRKREGMKRIRRYSSVNHVFQATTIGAAVKTFAFRDRTRRHKEEKEREKEGRKKKAISVPSRSRKLKSSGIYREGRDSFNEDRKSRKHEAVKTLFRGDFGGENGGRCCRRSFVGSTFGPFTWPPLAESLVIDVPPCVAHYYHFSRSPYIYSRAKFSPCFRRRIIAVAAVLVENEWGGKKKKKGKSLNLANEKCGSGEQRGGFVQVLVFSIRRETRSRIEKLIDHGSDRGWERRRGSRPLLSPTFFLLPPPPPTPPLFRNRECLDPVKKSAKGSDDS